MTTRSPGVQRSRRTRAPGRGCGAALGRTAWLLVVLAILTAALPAAAVDYYVRVSGSDAASGLSPATAWLTVQHAADVAGPGDTVHVGAGTYFEELRFRNSGTAAQPIRFVADTDGSATGDAGAVVLRHDTKDTVNLDKADHVHLVGFAIVAGKQGVKVKDSVGVRLEACDVDGASGPGLGDKGVEIEKSEVTLSGCTIHGFGKEGVVVKKDSSVLVDGTTIRDNLGEGLEIDDEDGAVTARDCDVFGNGKDGIHVGKGSLSLEACAVHDNADAGIFVDHKEALLEAERCDLLGNGEEGLRIKRGEATVTNCVIHSNGADGIANDDSDKDGVGLTIWHTTIADNVGAGIAQGKKAVTDLWNSIVAGNGGAGLDRGSGTLNHDYNLFWANAGGDFVGTGPGANELFADPLFVGGGDYHLLAGSPAIDAGTDASAITTVDRDGNARPQGGGFDLGAYEGTSSVAGFVIAHDGAGIHCLDEPVTVTAVDAAGNTLTGYTGTITLDTQTGSGDWASDPGNANPVVDATPGDGLAQYTFAAGDNGTATFLLSYRSGTPTFDIDAWDSASPAVRDDDTEGPITFAPSGFTVTATVLPNPPPDPINDPVGNQTAGVPFALHITAYGQTPTDTECGVIESYAGTRPLAFWFDAVDPGTPVLAVTVDGVAIPATEAGSLPRNVTFTSGQASVIARYDDVGRIRIHVKDESVAEPAGGIRGATAPFVVRPADLVVVAVERLDATPNPGGTTPTDPVFVAAGAPFRVVVQSVDAEGDPTPSYGTEATPEGLRITAALVAPAGGRNGSGDDGAIGNATAFTATATPGRFEGSTFYWDEVGAITLTASVADGDYLGSGDVSGTPSAPVGRFVPDHFDVTLNSPELETGCPSGAFTWIGAPFDYAAGRAPSATVTARNVQGATTANYAGAWMRITPATVTGLSYTTAAGALAAPAPDPPTVTDLGAGLVAVTFDAGPPLAFVRGAPVASFDAEIALAFDLADADGVVAPGNPLRFGDAVPGAGIAFTAGNEMRWGRVALGNAAGSELLPLPVPLVTEYWDGLAFVRNTADGCTSLPLSALALTPSPAGLPTVPTLANDPVAAGDAGLVLGAPGAGNTGTVDLVFDLSAATGAGLPWLRYDWDGDGSHDDDPAGRATFGVFAGDDALIYLRELY